ncbi:MAG: DUF6754 domain-containing protein [candidate division WOR-3 bacterium]
MIMFLSFIGLESIKFEGLGKGLKIVIKYDTTLRVDSVKLFKTTKTHPTDNPLTIGTLSYPDSALVDTTGEDGKYLLRVYYGGEKFDTGWIAINSDPQTSIVQENRKNNEKAPSIIAFDSTKTNILISILLFAFLFSYMLFMARVNPNLYIRRIAGLDAIDEAVGRTAELGKPIIYTTGIGSIDSLSILAGLTVLKHVTKKSALYEVPVIMPNNDPLVLATAREVVKEAYMESGRPDLYNENDIFFLTTEQFGFASGISGMMHRMKPGAVFMMGYFYAESLILAENANISGAISTAGTTAIDQLPFFVAACDYTIIGDELYAASAYISRNPLEVASIKTGDWFKALSVFFVLLGSLLATLTLFNPQLKVYLDFLTGTVFGMGR